jgi:hypothetical protein
MGLTFSILVAATALHGSAIAGEPDTALQHAIDCVSSAFSLLSTID